MLKRPLKSRLLAAGIACTLAAAACGSGDKTDSDGGTDDSGIDTGTPVIGGSLTLALEADNPGGLCLPEGQLAASGIQMAEPVFEPLVAYDENLVPKPFLAESVDTNATMTEYTFKLRKGIKFHDGTDFDAEIVKLNIDAWRGTAENKAITGREPVLLSFSYSDIANVAVVDPLTVKVTTKRTWNGFLSVLAAGRSGIMARSQLVAPKVECQTKWVGTGPFQLVSWQAGQPAVLKKNPNYWRKDKNGVQLPYLDNLKFVPIKDSNVRKDQLKAGQVDAIQTSSESVMSDIEALPDFAVLREADGHREVAYGLVNHSRAPFNDIEVRRAFAQVLDRDKLNDISNLGAFAIADQPFDTKTIAYDPSIKMIDRDPDAGGAFLKSKNIKFTLLYATDPNTAQLAKEIKRQLGEVGVEVDISEVDQGALITTAVGGKFDVALWRNHPGADPDTQYNWWYSKSILNFGHINDPEVDKLLDEGRTSVDESKRRETYQKLSRLMSEKYYNAWNWYTEWGFPHKKEVRNLDGATLPDGTKAAKLNWGFTNIAESWIQK